MSYTIRQFVNRAFEEIGMATYQFDLSADMLQSAAGKLVAMLADWNAKGIRLGATLTQNPDNVDLDAASNVPDMANRAVVACLAIEIAPAYGKTVSMDTKAAARSGYNTLLARTSEPPEMQLPRIPAGAGNKPWRYDDPFLPRPAEPLNVGPDGPLEFQ